MNLFIISSFLICSLAVYVGLKRTKSIEDKSNVEFWEREKKANSTRKQPLTDLEYITIPDELLQMRPKHITDEINSYLLDLNDLSSYKIVNLTGLSNTDLKLKYGTANITILSEYDFHYTNLVTLLQKLAECLHENNEDLLAIQTLEFAISTNTDISKSYYLLAELYNNVGTPEKISQLIEHAECIHSLLKNTIVQNLKASGQ